MATVNFITGDFINKSDEEREQPHRINWQKAKTMMNAYKTGDNKLDVKINGQDQKLEGLMLDAHQLLNVLKVDANGNANVDRIYLGISDRDDNMGNSIVVIGITLVDGVPIYENDAQDHIYDYCDPCPPACPQEPA